MFWMKLHIKEHEDTKEDNVTHLDSDEECKELKRYFSTLNIVVHKVIKKKVCEFTYSWKTSIVYQQ